MPIRRDIQYLNKDFTDYRSRLINYAQSYFPTTYTDFSPSSPGVMFIELASYVGDVLSFYLDNQIQENFLQYVRQTNNIYDLAYMFGYKPKVTGLSNVNLDFFQLVPSKVEGTATVPDFRYSLFIDANTQVGSTQNSSVNFIIEDPIDFSVSNSLDPTTVSVAQISGGEPSYYLLKKSRKANSGNINTTSFTFGSPEEFPTVEIKGSNIAEIIDIFDSDGNQYFEVDNLAQDLIFDSIKNNNINDPNNSGVLDTPYILKTKKVQRRFATRFLDSGSLQLQFGSGNPNNTDEEIIPNPDNVGLGLPFEINKLTTAFSPTNFIFTNTYGTAPTNTTLTVRYLNGGGVDSNVNANTVTQLDTTNIRFINQNLNSNTAQFIFDSLAANNPSAASGGQDGDSVEEIRQNTLSNFNSQLRNVTADDYLVRALSMPSKFGVIAKAYTQKPKADESNTTLDLYTLTYNNVKNLTIPSLALKNNLKSYINQYRMIGDTINIRDAFIINIGIEFEIITLPNFNNSEVLTNCLNTLIEYFNIDNWQINQPIILKDLEVTLDRVNGVQTVNKILISNKAGTNLGYSKFAYDVNGANQNGIIYPSLDPSIFEVKFPTTDIKGKVITI